MAADYAMFTNLAKLALSPDASAPARAIASFKLKQLKTWLLARPATTTSEEWTAFYGYLGSLIARMEEDPEEFKIKFVQPSPPGQPIGDYDQDYCGYGKY